MAAGFVFSYPLFGELAGLDFGKDLFHLFAGFGGDDAGSAGVVAVFGGVGDGEAHVAEASFIDEIDDQLELVEAFEVGDFGGIACFNESFESGADEFGCSSAQHRLLSKKVAFGFFAKVVSMTPARRQPRAAA